MPNSTAIAPREPVVAGVTQSADLVARARALIPALRERGRAADEVRHLPQETIDELLEAGILQFMAPRRFGGIEGGLTTFFDLGQALGEGDGSTSWLFGILAAHHWVLSHFPIAAQEALYGDRNYALFPLTFSGKGGTARAVDGGYRVSGHWSFASGVDFSDWVGALARLEGSDSKTVNLLMPKDQVEVVDNWFMSGMRATGSRDFVVDDVFVPQAFSLDQDALMSGRTPGAAIFKEYTGLRTPLHIVLLLATAGAVFGLAKRAIDEFIAFTCNRSGYGGIDHAARTSTQIRVSAALARWSAFHDRVRAQFVEIDEQVQSGKKFSPEQRLRFRRDVAVGAAECAAIINDIVIAAGARSQHLSSPFQLIQRDINTVCTHVILDAEDANELYGKLMLGQELGPVRQ